MYAEEVMGDLLAVLSDPSAALTHQQEDALRSLVVNRMRARVREQREALPPGDDDVIDVEEVSDG